MLIESERQNFRMQMMQQEQKTTEQLRDLKDQQYKLQGQVPNFKEKLDLYKKEFSTSSVLVSEETYVELKARPED